MEFDPDVKAARAFIPWAGKQEMMAKVELDGRSRKEVLEDSVRGGLAAPNLGEVKARVRTRSDLNEGRATRVAYEEVRAVRSARRSGRRAVSESRDDSPL